MKLRREVPRLKPPNEFVVSGCIVGGAAGSMLTSVELLSVGLVWSIVIGLAWTLVTVIYWIRRESMAYDDIIYSNNSLPDGYAYQLQILREIGADEDFLKLLGGRK